jgi:tetratricopeptide (TPR) repeat protein
MDGAGELNRIARGAVDKLKEISTVPTPAASVPTARTFSPLHETAAVMLRFRIADLQELAGNDEEDVGELLSDSVPLDDPEDAGAWALLPEVRDEVLSRLTDIQAALMRARQDDPLVMAIRSMLVEGKSIETLSIASLAAVSPFMPALQKIVPTLPSRVDVDRQLEWLRLLQPFERLVGTHFGGRASELQTLSDYVGVLPTDSKLEMAKRSLQNFDIFARKNPLLVWGVGGVGKSTLIAKFILDHAQLDPTTRFPFAYLDFDRRAVMADEPATILVEAMRQIGVQYAQAFASAESLRRKWRASIASSSQQRGGMRGMADPSTRQRILQEFRSFLQTLAVAQGPILLVLDTFEEVQYRGSAYVREIGRFLGELREMVPRLRIVIVGRARVSDLDLEKTLELGEFDPEAAAGVLAANGVTDTETARAIVKQVGGNPLTLRLAAVVVREEGATKDGIASIEKKRFGFFSKILGATIQGQLFERILDHIHTEAVKKIAYPGLVLRRVTRDLIRYVLAVPCEIEVPDDARAEELFEELSRELALISPIDAGAVEHRSDVRRIMLDPLRQSQKEKVRMIHERAVEYYASLPASPPDPIARAEEIYHRLSLHEDFDKLTPRFEGMPGLRPLLANALDELDAPERAYLADRLQIEIPSEARSAATQEIWERDADRRALQLFELSDYKGALKVMGERSERSSQTLLRVHEATALAYVDRLKDAAKVAEEAIAAYDAGSNVPAMFEALLIAAEIDAARTYGFEAMPYLRSAEEIARDRRDDVLLLRVLVIRYPLARRLGTDVVEVRAALHDTAMRLDDATWSREAPLLRLAVSYADDDTSIERAIRLVGFADILPRQQRALDAILAELGVERPYAVRQALHALITHGQITLDLRECIDDIFRNGAPVHFLAAGTDIEQKATPNLKIEYPTDVVISNAILSAASQRVLSEILEGLGRHIESLSVGGTFRAVLSDVTSAAVREGWMPALLDVLRKTYPGNAEIQQVATNLRIGVTPVAVRGDSLEIPKLEQIVNKHWTIVTAMESRICRIETRDGQMPATGFLIDPSLVMTYLGKMFDASALIARFDYGAIDGKPYTNGTACGVVAMRAMQGPDGPYPIFLTLDRPIGREKVGGDAGSSDAPPRGVIDVPGSSKRVAAEQLVLWMGHDRRLALRIAGAKVANIEARSFAIPVSNQDFAGAPCFDEDFNFVGLHCGAHPRIKNHCLVLSGDSAVLPFRGENGRATEVLKP